VDIRAIPFSLGAPAASLVAALTRLLRPLVRLMLNHGVTYPLLTDLLKSVYVEVAAEEFPVEGKKQTDSRISLLTGVHRKDVKRLRTEERRPENIPTAVSLGAQLVARWTGLPAYLDEDGEPRPLPRLASNGGPVSFEGLVESVSKDLRSRVVLDEWLRLGVARVDERDRVCLNVAAFIPERGFDEKAYYFGRNVHDHLAAGAHNLLGERPPFTERSVYYDKLTPAAVDALAQRAKEAGMQALQTVNRHAMELQRQTASDPEATLRMNFGIYFYNAPTGDAADE
jgi:uncharacterized protein DUF6502